MNDPLGLFDNNDKNDPLGLFTQPSKPKAGLGTAVKSSFAGVGNVVDRAWSGAAGALADTFGAVEERDQIFKEMQDRIASRDKWANPEQQELTTGGKVAGALATLPMQVLSFPLSPFESGQRATEAGEDLNQARAAASLDALGNVAGVAVPPLRQVGRLGRIGAVGAVNAAQDYGTKAGIQSLMATEEGQAAFNPTLEDALVAGVVGGGVGAVGKTIPKKQTSPKIEAIKQAFKEPQKVDTKVKDKSKPIENLTALEDNTKQMSLFDMDEQIQPRTPFQAEEGVWRTDENGIPIRADLSMEAQFDTTPLQRDLFVDPNGEFAKLQDTGYYDKTGNLVETPTKSMQSALDELDWAHKRGALNQSGLMKGAIEADGPLKAAAMEAEGLRFIPQSQRGAINVEAFSPGFKQTKQLDNGVELRAKGMDEMLSIEAYKNGARVAGALFEPKDLGVLPEVNDAQATMVGSKVKGTASELYKFAAELGNDIVPSEVRTQGGQALWDKMKREGIVKGTKKPFIPRSQSGVIYLGAGKDGKAADQFSKIPGIKDKLSAIIPDLEKTTEQVIEESRNSKDVDQNVFQKGFNWFTKGALYQAQKTGNPLIRHTAHTWLNADRVARGKVQEYIHDGLAPAYRKLTKAEATEVGTLLNLADLNHSKEITPEFLKDLGLSKNQMEAVQIHQAVMDQAFNAINEARIAAGKPEIDRRIAYAAMRATGDYKRLVYDLDKDGNKVVVGIIGSNFRARTNYLADSLTKKGYLVGEEQTFGKKSFGSSQNQISQLMEHLADTNPATKDFLNVISDIEQDRAYNFINQKKHTKSKKGIFGMEGRKDWESDYQNAKDLMNSQLLYAENSFRWSELSKAMGETKKILASDLNQPNAKQWIESYTDNALGLNPTKWGQDFQKSFDSIMYSTGLGPSAFKSGAATTRQAVNTLLLSINVPFWITQMYQPLATLPGMSSWLQSKGVDSGAMGFDYFSKGSISAIKRIMGSEKLSDIEKNAFQYAKDKAVYTADLIDTSTRSRKDAGYYFDKVGSFVSAPLEAGTRFTTFMTYVHMLSDSGITSKDGLYEAAHNLTDMAVVNYSKQERPQAFNALGTVGELGANLQSYKFNELSKIAMFARAAKEDKTLKPIVTQLMMYIIAAGVVGIPGFSELDELYKQLSKTVYKEPKSLTEDVIRVSEKMGNYLNQDTPESQKVSQYLLSHGTFSQFGVDMSKRLGMGDLIPNTFVDAAFPGATRLYSILDSGSQFMIDPSEYNAKLLGREVLPNGMQGPIDRAWFSNNTAEGEFGINKKDPSKTGPVRTSEDKFWKTLGATGINESVQREKLWRVEETDRAYRDIRQSALKKMIKDIHTKDDITEHIQSYLDANGDPSSLERELTTKLQQGNISAITAAKIKASTAKTITQQKKAQHLMEQYEN